MKFRIRKEQDLELISKLDGLVFADTDEAIDTAGYWWVATHNREPIAYAGLKLFDTPAGVTAYFHRAGVLREARGHSVHNRLLKARLDWSQKQQDAVAAITYTMYYNVSSNNNLIQAGFYQYMPEYTWAGTEDVIYWMKSL